MRYWLLSLILAMALVPTGAGGLRGEDRITYDNYINTSKPQVYKNVLVGGMFTSGAGIRKFVQDNPYNPVNGEKWDLVVACGKEQDGTIFPIIYEVGRVMADNLGTPLLSDISKLKNIVAENVVSHSNGNDMTFLAFKYGFLKADHWVMISPPNGYQGKVNSMLDSEVRDIQIYHSQGDLVVSTLGKYLIPPLAAFQSLFDVKIGLIQAGDQTLFGFGVNIPLGEGNRLSPHSIKEYQFKPGDSEDPFLTRSDGKDVFFMNKEHIHALSWEINKVALYKMNELEKAYNRNPQEAYKPKIEQELLDFCNKFPQAMSQFINNWAMAEMPRELPPKVMQLVPGPPSLNNKETTSAPKNTIPSYWTSADRPGVMAEAETMAAFARGKDRVLVVGQGEAAARLFDKSREILGPDRVKWVQQSGNWAQEARAFGANAVLGLKSTAAVKLPVKDEVPKSPLDSDLKKHPGGPPPEFSTGNIGGVMLVRPAAHHTSPGTGENFSQEDFSLVFNNSKGEIDFAALRRFVTALWAVYFSREGPGLSIDPIAPGGKKHLVRYIGKLLNLDLGRVARESDYLMKRLAVGTEKTRLQGFKSVDALSRRHGLNYLGAGRRFWFVPEDMTFARAGDALVWMSGRMCLKTEFYFQNKKTKAEPADEEFARFFTEHYTRLAQDYPVLAELWDYARLVAFCQYLKEQQVPLLWFLLANKELVLTEDSPGTVDAIIKPSEHLPGVQIEGGVDLAWKPQQGTYVLDREAAEELKKALDRGKRGTTATLKPTITKTMSFNVKEKNLSATPSQALSLGQGTSSCGNYYTDLNLRRQASPALELVRYYNPHLPDCGVFGRGWHLLIPYEVAPEGEETQNFHGVPLPRRMTVKNLVNGHREALNFTPDRYRLAGYIPSELKNSQVVGLFLLTDGSSRLIDKLGNEFHFNGAGKLTEMSFSETCRVKVEYHQGLVPLSREVYRVEPEIGEMRHFHNVAIPARMRVHNLFHGQSEVLVWGQLGTKWGYLPIEPSTGGLKIMTLRTDGSFKLATKSGREFLLDAGGAFKGLLAAPGHGLVQSLKVQGDQLILDYGVNDAGEVCVISARLLSGEEGKETSSLTYCYDNHGNMMDIIKPEQSFTRTQIGKYSPALLACR